ncbi:MAG: hypothetical protein GC185_02425 [Alphaproteobacteria bacterium]|nr:hypothetical protein [Alphaproteobacteria bacterium]
MQEVFRTQDILEVAWLKHVLNEADIPYHIFGEHMNAMGAGMFGMDAACCRFMVEEDDYDEACALLREGGLDPYEP